jgi:hypothetical protein
MERMVVLKYTGTPADGGVQISLHHDIVCARRQKCTCKTINPIGKAAKPRRLEASLRFLPGEVSKPVSAFILSLPHVKHLLRIGKLVLLDETLQVEEV